MKKIYSILLMAVALLISTNLKAVEHAASSQALLQQYLDEATSGDVIKLTDNIHLTSQLYFYREKGTKITLDLNGKTIDNNSAQKPTRLVRIYRGELLITSSNGTGYISQNAYVGATTNTFLMDIFGTAAQGEAAENHTVVTIDQNVTLVNNCHAISSGKEKAYGYGISILELRNTKNGNTYFMKDRNENVIPNYVSVFKKADGTTATTDGFANGIVLTIKGRIEASKYCIKVNGYVRTPHYMLETYNYTNTKYDVSEIESPSLTGKNAIVLDDEGAYDLKDSVAALACAPKVTIAATAELEGMANVSNSTSVYASGLGDWTIEGTVTGNTPVWIRTGNVTIDGATIQSTSTVYQAVNPASTGSGTDAIGSAIVIETDARYSNESSLTVKGDAKIEANTGYAIEEAIHYNADSVAKVNAINLEGGSFTGGNQGLIHITTSTLDNNVTTVSGGKFDNYTAQDNATITSIITGEDNHAIYVNNGTGIQPTLVVGQGDAPAQVDATFSFADIQPLDSASVDLSAVTAGELTLDANLTILKDLVMNGTNAVTIIVKEEQTLAVRQLTMAASAKIIVEPGGKLIIYGTNGITANSVNNIVVEASEAAQGQVLFNPDVKSGRHPKATVQFKSNSYTNVSQVDYGVQYFCAPIYNGEIESIALSADDGNDYLASFRRWDLTAWSARTMYNATDLSIFNGNFGFYQMQSNNPSTVKVTASFKGNVNGNNDQNITLVRNWATFSNAYLGNIDVQSVIDAVSTLGVHPYVYVYTTNDNGRTMTWSAKEADDMESVAPMSPMMFQNSTGAVVDLTLDYEDLVWTPATTPAPAPVRGNIQNITRATIVMSGNNQADDVVLKEAADFADAISATKYMNEGMNIFFSANDEKFDILKTDNANGANIGYSVTKAGIYTLTFNNVQGHEFVLVDLANGAQTNIEEGATYTFAASANETNDARFQIVEARKMPTDVEVVDAAKAQKGIYNMVGQYLGEDFDVLPAGIYVVNGVKVVK